jgi:hypothetical protein
VNAIGSVLLNIECPGCRELSAHTIETSLPGFLKDVQVQATQRWGGQTSGHIH